MQLRHLVVLERVVGKVLRAVGEHHAIDLGVRPFADQGDVLVDLGQPAAQCADGPLQRGVAADERLVMGEVPDARAPILQVHVAQPCAGADEDFHRAAVQPGRRRIDAGGLGQHRGLAPSSSTIKAWPKSLCPGESDENMCSGCSSIDHALGHVEQHAAGPAGGVQSRELVVIGIDGAGEQIRLDLLAMLPHKLVQAAEEHASRGQFGIERGSRRPAIQGRGLPGQIDAGGKQCAWIAHRPPSRRFRQPAPPSGSGNFSKWKRRTSVRRHSSWRGPAGKSCGMGSSRKAFQALRRRSVSHAAPAARRETTRKRLG